MFRFLVLSLWMVLAGPGLAGIRMDTSINDVPLGVDHAQVGVVFFTVTGDELAAASADTPIYLRVTLDHRTLLADTLVDQGSADPELQQPINLALQVDGAPGVTCVADATAVRVVRWVAGEAAFWLAVSQSSDLWVSEDGVVGGPGPDRDVSFGVGISARISDQAYSNEPPHGASNLPFNTRAAAPAEGDYADAVSSLLCVDMRTATTTTDGSFESLVGYDVVAFDHRADLGDGAYAGAEADNIGITFFGDFYLARTRSLACVAEAGSGTTVFTGYQQGLATLRHEITTLIDCEQGGNFYTVRLYPGSRFRFRITTPDVGFPVSGAAGFADLAGEVVVLPDSAVDVGGVTLYQEIDLVYTGTQPQNVGFDTFALYLAPWYVSAAGLQVDIDQTVHVTGPDGADQAPYDGAHQQRLCAPYDVVLDGLQLQCDTPPGGICPQFWPEQTVLELISRQGEPCPAR